MADLFIPGIGRITPEQWQAMQARSRQLHPWAHGGAPAPYLPTSPLAGRPVQLPQRPAPAGPASFGGGARFAAQGGAGAGTPGSPFSTPTTFNSGNGRIGWTDAPISVDLREQQPDESWGRYATRSVLGAPISAAGWMIDQAGRLARGVQETPAQAAAARAAARPEAGGGVGGPQDLATAFGAAGGSTPAINPFAGFRSTSGPGDSRPGGRTHAGRDWAMPMGSPIIAPRNWRVLGQGEDGRSGRWARVMFDDGTVHSYSHLSAFPQQNFGTAGSPIALTGRSGNATGPSVHVRSWIGGNEVDPASYYASGGSPASPGSMIPPMAFDESGYREAMGMNAQAAQLMHQPMEQSWNPGAAPAVPAPTPIQPTDFTAVDKRLEAARPEGDTDREQRRMQRRGWLAGIARGLASVDLSATGGAGVGQLFAAVGAGALAGRQSADEEIQRREDLHDQQMREYELLMANHETVRANDVAQTIRYNSQQAYDHSLRQFELRYRDWEVQARPQISGGRIFTTRVNAETGERTVRSAPIDNSALAGALMANAQITQAIAAGRNQVGQANWQFNAAQVLTRAAESGEPQDMATAISIRVAEALQSGVVHSVMSPEDMQEMSQAAWQSATAQIPLSMTGTAADAQRTQIMQTQLIAGVTARAMQDQALRAALMGGSGQLGSAASSAYRHMNRDESTRTSRNARGLPTVTSTVRQ